LAVDR